MNALLNLINHQSDIGKFFLYAKDPYESNNQYLIKTWRSWSKTSQGILKWYEDVYSSIEEYNPRKKRKVLTVFDDTIVDIISNK